MQETAQSSFAEGARARLEAVLPAEARVEQHRAGAESARIPTAPPLKRTSIAPSAWPPGRARRLPSGPAKAPGKCMPEEVSLPPAPDARFARLRSVGSARASPKLLQTPEANDVIALFAPCCGAGLWIEEALHEGRLKPQKRNPLHP